jgi:hypothetical protein
MCVPFMWKFMCYYAFYHQILLTNIKYQILFSWLTLGFNAPKDNICVQFYVPMPTLSLNTLFKLMYIYFKQMLNITFMTKHSYKIIS